MTNSETKNFSQNVSSSYHLGGKCSNECKKDSLNVPKLRFKGYNYNYDKIPLKNIAVRIKRVNSVSKAPIMMISANSGFIMQSEKYSRDNAGKSLTKYTILHKGELAYNHGASKMKPYGCCFQLNVDEARIPYVYHCFKINENNYAPYIALYLNNKLLERELRKLVSSSVRMDGLLNISYEDYTNIKLNLPRYEEQEKIAAFLTLIDKKIEKQKELVELLKKYKRGLLSQIFSQKLRFKDDNGNWKKIKLDKIGYFLGGGTPSKNKLEYWNGNIPWVSSSDISENSIDNINISRFITKNAVNNSSTKICPNGTICIVSRVGVGKLAISKQCVCTSQDFVNFINTTNNNNYYIAYYLKEIMKRKVLKTQGTSIKGITSLEIKNIQISLPKIEIQNKIASLLKYNDYLINANESFIKFLIQYKKGLLQQLFI